MYHKPWPVKVALLIVLVNKGVPLVLAAIWCVVDPVLAFASAGLAVDSSFASSPVLWGVCAATFIALAAVIVVAPAVGIVKGRAWGRTWYLLVIVVLMPIGDLFNPATATWNDFDLFDWLFLFGTTGLDASGLLLLFSKASNDWFDKDNKASVQERLQAGRGCRKSDVQHQIV